MRLHAHNISYIQGSPGRVPLLWSLFFFLALTFLSCSDAGQDRSRRSARIAVALQEVRKMDSCRVVAANRDFYLHKYKAEQIIERYSSKSTLTHNEAQALMKAESGLAYSYTDYLLQVGKRADAYNVMRQLSCNTSINLYSDTTQWLNFLYHQGKVYFSPYYVERDRQHILQGYDNLVQGYILSSRLHNDFYKGKFLLALSMYFQNDSIVALASGCDRASIRYLNEDDVADSLLAGNMAERSLDIFLRLNQPYYTAEAWLALARCYFKIGDARQSVQCLDMAMANPAIDSMPDLRASISEQMSLSYAALDDKHNSDLFRNEYLDIQDSTRQDRELEARAMSLEYSANKLWGLVCVALLVFVSLCMMTIILVRIRKGKEKKASEDDDELEDLQEDLQTRGLQVVDAMRSAVEQRARFSVITGMIPLIDRLSIAVSKHDYAYAGELADEIDRQNTMLTQWIKMRRGLVKPRIEAFALRDIVGIISKNASSLAASGVSLVVTGGFDVKVKADMTLTLFMVNTLIDNARKAMEQGGVITLDCAASAAEGYAEISVSDTGKGMPAEQVDHLFEYKVIHDTAESTSHGFGLANCRGIMDRYRKISSLFSVCAIKASSTLGRGTRISFRLPLALRLLLVTVMMPLAMMGAVGKAEETAVRYCDSLYRCNIDGRYADAMRYADSCYALVKRMPKIDAGVRLSLYNETAVAALALHQWEKYAYFNYRYITLYKEVTSDSTISTYCEQMERNGYWANVAVVVVIFLILSLAPIFWFVYLRHILAFHQDICNRKESIAEEARKVQQQLDRLHVANNITDNQLSTLKHETMYYPVRIRQLLGTDCSDEELRSVVCYYSELYKTLSLHAMGDMSSAFTFKVSRMSVTEVFTDAVAEAVSDVAEGSTDDMMERAGDASGVTITANRELMQYLRFLLRRSNGGKTPRCTVVQRGDGYVVLRFVMSGNPGLRQCCERLFTAATPDADFLIMRQIVRETADSSLRYAAGIRAKDSGDGVVIEVKI